MNKPVAFTFKPHIIVTSIMLVILAVSYPIAAYATVPGVASTPADNGVPTGGVGPIQQDFNSAFLYSISHPGSAPQGINNFSCKSTKHVPVILIPGTAEDAYAAWSQYAPKLADAGFCVYSFNHNPLVIHGKSLEWSAFSGDTRESAQALSVFVDRVLTATGAQKVDLVGHSQGGGPLPHVFIQELNGAAKVRKLIGLAPPNHGTEAYNLPHVFETFPDLRKPYRDFTGRINGSAWEQQVKGSSLLADISRNGFTRPGISYTFIGTRYDKNVLPYTSPFIQEPGVKNITLQDVCKANTSNHYNLPYDPTVFQLVVHELTDSNTPVSCSR
jgi:Lipase (class 2).